MKSFGYNLNQQSASVTLTAAIVVLFYLYVFFLHLWTGSRQTLVCRGRCLRHRCRRRRNYANSHYIILWLFVVDPIFCINLFPSIYIYLFLVNMQMFAKNLNETEKRVSRQPLRLHSHLFSLLIFNFSIGLWLTIAKYHKMYGRKLRIEMAFWEYINLWQIVRIQIRWICKRTHVEFFRNSRRKKMKKNTSCCSTRQRKKHTKDCFAIINQPL